MLLLPLLRSGQVLQERQMIHLQTAMGMRVNPQVCGYLSFGIAVTPEQMIGSAQIGMHPIVIRKFNHRLLQDGSRLLRLSKSQM